MVVLKIDIDVFLQLYSHAVTIPFFFIKYVVAFLFLIGQVILMLMFVGKKLKRIQCGWLIVHHLSLAH